MKKLKNIPIYKIIGYILIAIYLIAMAVFLFSAANLNMIPIKLMLIIGVCFAILAAVFAIMHEKLFTSIIASLLTIAVIVLSVLGVSFIRKTGNMITDVSTADRQTNTISVYVMKDDPAEKLDDAKDYKFGRAHSIDTTNTDQAIAKFEKDLGSSLDVKDYDTMFLMMDDLKSAKIGAIIINEAYTGIASDVEGYEWVETELKKIASMGYEVEQETKIETPEEVPETFVMYL